MRSTTRRIGVALLALVAVAAGVASPSAEASFPGGNGKIALARFYVPGTPSAAIFTVNPGGGTPSALIHNGLRNFDPAWSANGNQIAYDTCPTTRNCNVFAANADGTGVTQITNSPNFEEFPRWSPDGDALVFMRLAAGNMDLYVKHLGSGVVTRLTASSSFDEFPEFSPDGTKVAFGSNRSGNFDIWIKNVNTGATTRVTTDLRADSYPSWSPDGTKIAFQSTRDGNLDIWIKDLSSGTTTQVTRSQFGDRYPTWSPDGTRIAFTRTANGHANLWIANVGAQTLTQVTSDTGKLGFVTPSWQPQ
jgi:tol-pal system beta propeller repeat protein TolB